MIIRILLAFSAALFVAAPALADDVDGSLASTLYTRIGFGGAAEQATGLRYGLFHDQVRAADAVVEHEPVWRFEFEGRSLVSMRVQGVELAPVYGMLRAAEGGLLAPQNMFLLGTAGVAAAVSSGSRPRDGGGDNFSDLDPDNEPTEEEGEGEEPPLEVFTADYEFAVSSRQRFVKHLLDPAMVEARR